MKRILTLILLTVTIHANAQSGFAGSQIITVQSAKTSGAILLSGHVISRTQSGLNAEVPGRIVWIAGKEGDTFKKGDLLIKINDATLQAKLRSADIARRATWYAIYTAKLNLDNSYASPNNQRSMPGMAMPKLFDQMVSDPMSSMIGTQEPGFDRYVSRRRAAGGVRQAEAAFYQATAGVQELKAKIRDTETVAPFTGVITEKFVEVGDTVQPGMPLIKFADSQKQIEVQVPMRLLRGGNLKLGDIVDARLDDLTPHWGDVKVVQIFPHGDPSQHTVKVKFDLPPSAPATMPGSYAEIMLNDPSASKQGLPSIPTSALVRKGSFDGVYIAKRMANGKMKNEVRLIRLGTVKGNNVEVLSGLSAGEMIYANPPKSRF